MTFTIKALDPDTWDAYSDLIERHNGVWGGCWCIWFHRKPAKEHRSREANRQWKKDLVFQGQSRAAVVFDGDRAVGWCQWGTPDQLPHIYHKKEYEAAQAPRPDYRLTCFFVDKEYRKQGVAALALRGALDQIAQAGGGVVEAYPQDTQGKTISSSFLYSGTRRMFEAAGFAFDRPKGKVHCVMTKRVSRG